MIYIDDNTGNSAIHGGGRSALGNIAATSRHYQTSIICIAHQGTSVTPTFRKNLTHLIAFPCRGKTEVEFLLDESGDQILYDKATIKRMIIHAWKGGRNDTEEYGQHFMLSYKPPRGVERYFIDFEHEILPADQ